jgi:glyoxylase-like metal-dependent hydrolase (beta-lactamase superfamily II)
MPKTSIRTIFTAALLATSMLAMPSLAFAATGTPADLVQQAYGAMGLGGEYRLDGGAQARDTLVTLQAKGSMRQWDPGESDSVADLSKPDWGTATFTSFWDRSKQAHRIEWVRPKAGGGTRNYTDIFSAEGGVVFGVDVNGAMPKRTTTNATNMQQQHAMSSVRLAMLLREEERLHIVEAMNDNPERVSALPAQTAGGKTYPSVQYRGDSGTFIVMFDPDTKLPAIVRTREFDVLMGDANYDATLSDWRQVGSFRKPFKIVHTLNGQPIFDTTIESYTANQPFASDAFNLPIAIRRNAPTPLAADKMNWQWPIRRMANGFYLDSDAMYTDDGNQLALTDVGPNISLASGGSHNTLIVATDSYLVAFDAPGDDGLSQKVMQMAKAKYPGKNFKYLVLTHHHVDHTGGLRAYVQDGASLVVGNGNGAFFRGVLTAPATLNPYKVPGSANPTVIEVDGKWSVNDGGRAIEAYSLDTAHATGYIIPYIPDAKMGFVTDLWNPGPMVAAVNPAMTSIVRGMEKAGLTPDKFAGGHGAVGSYGDLARAVGPAR